MSAPVPINAGCCVSPCPDNPQTAVPGPAGENAFSLTTANFTQPASGANVTISLSHDGWIVPGQTLFLQGGGYYQVVSVSGLNATITNLGNTGNAAPGTVINSGAKVSPGGIGGNIGNAFTTTTANYVQPNVGAQVNVSVVTSNWAAVGENVFIATGGTYTVFSIPDGTHLNLTNLGEPQNAAPAAVINSPQQVTPSGVRGAAGAAGFNTLNAVSPTTTKGDIIADNGANSPLASDVRLGVGTNGKALVADSSQATGLNYATITPNTVATSGDIAIYNGSSGTPTPLQDSKMLISSTGALQSTPSGGNARGTSAIDLQVVRGANTDVASGNTSTIGGGQSNTSSGIDSTIAGGNGNIASQTGAAVGGGTTNTSSGSNSFSAGTTNVASGVNSTAIGGGNTASANACVAFGSGCSATSNNATVGGGLANTASGVAATVPGGKNCLASANDSIASGEDAVAYLFGQRSHCSGKLAVAGDAQISDLIMRDTTGDATPTELFLNGAFTSLRAVVPLNTSWAFRILLIGRSSAGVCAAWNTLGAIQNNAATVSLVAAVTQTVIADGTGGTWGLTANFAVTADNVNKSLKLQVTGAALTNISWVARIHLVEAAF